MHNPNKIFAGIFFLGVIVVSLLSCVVKSPCPTVDTTTVTKKDSVSIKDSLAKIKEKDGGDINFSFVAENEKSECDSIKSELKKLKDNPVIKHYDGVTSSIKTDGKKITFDCKCDSFEIALKKLKIEHWALINSTKDEKVLIQCDKQHHTPWDTFGNWCAWFLILCVVICIVFFIFHLMGTGKKI